jgi:transcription antitermination factor NusB
MRKRSRARELALQILYQIDLRGPEVLADIEDMLSRERRDEDVVEFALRLVRGTSDRRDEIDGRIRATAEHWDLPRMAVLDRNILRMATWELLENEPGAPPKVVLNEAIELGKRFSTGQSGAFINGILDKILKNLNHERQGSSEG